MRTQSENTVSYIFRNFFILLPFALVPSVLLGLFSVDHSDVTVFVNYLVYPQSVSQLKLFQKVIEYFSVFNFSDKNWLWFSLSCLVFVFCLCLLMTNVQRNMRLGVNSWNNLFKTALSMFPSTLFYFLINVAVAEVFTLAAAGFAYLFAMAVSDTVWVLTVTVILQIVVKMCFVMVSVLFICTLPAMQCEGLRINLAAGYSVRIISKYYLKVSFTVLYVFLASMALYYILPIYFPFLSRVVSIGYYLLWTLLLPCYAERIYAKFEEVERKDLKRVLFGD